MALLSDWVLLFTALGTSPLVLLPFLSDVVYLPVANGTLEWPIAFELLIVYLTEIEKNPDQWNLANVFSKSGAFDARRAEAELMARAHFPSHCFRTAGGARGKSNVDTPSGTFDLAKILQHNSTCKRGCVAWNNGVDHKAEHVDSNGRCKFAHACNQWVTDKGKGGQWGRRGRKRRRRRRGLPDRHHKPYTHPGQQPYPWICNE